MLDPTSPVLRRLLCIFLALATFDYKLEFVGHIVLLFQGNLCCSRYLEKFIHKQFCVCIFPNFRYGVSSKERIDEPAYSNSIVVNICCRSNFPRSSKSVVVSGNIDAVHVQIKQYRYVRLSQVWTSP